MCKSNLRGQTYPAYACNAATVIVIVIAVPQLPQALHVCRGLGEQKVMDREQITPTGIVCYFTTSKSEGCKKGMIFSYPIYEYSQ